MGGVQGRKRVHPRMGSLKSEQEQLARGRNPSQAINWSKQARLHPAEGLSHQEPWPLARSMLKADLERLPALRANSTCLTSETLERDGWGARGKGQALRGLYLQPWTLAPSTHLVWGGMGHTRSPPRRLPHCHSSPLGQSTLAGGWHTGKNATDTCHHLLLSLLCTEMSQERLKQKLSSPPPCRPTACQRVPTPKRE